jgi:hypothetical protein
MTNSNSIVTPKYTGDYSLEEYGIGRMQLRENEQLCTARVTKQLLRQRE